jgi:hypothetical protein
MAVAMGEAMLVERPAEPVVKDSRKTIGVLALAIIKGGRGLAMVQISVGTTITMLVVGATRIALRHMVE